MQGSQARRTYTSQAGRWTTIWYPDGGAFSHTSVICYRA